MSPIEGLPLVTREDLDVQRHLEQRDRELFKEKEKEWQRKGGFRAKAYGVKRWLCSPCFSVTPACTLILLLLTILLSTQLMVVLRNCTSTEVATTTVAADGVEAATPVEQSSSFLPDFSTLIANWNDGPGRSLRRALVQSPDTAPSLSTPAPPPTPSAIVEVHEAKFTRPLDVHPLGSPEGLKEPRVVVTSFVSTQTFHELDDFWDPLEKYFLKPHKEQFGMGDRLNFTLFYEIFPQDTRKLMDKWLSTQKFTLVEGTRWENHGLQVYRSPGGTLLQIQPLALNLPEYAADDVSLILNPDWMKCGRNKTFTFPYTFYNTVFTYHILRHPHMRGYDYFMKMDTDIIFQQPSPHSLFGDMAERQCVFAHANIVRAWANCQWRSNAAMHAYSARHSLRPLSVSYPWCRDESLYAYGNFIIGWLGYLRSPEALHYLDYLFNEWQEGYFKHRWTDQAVWPKLVCMFFDVPMIENNPQICDYSNWRHKIFKHV